MPTKKTTRKRSGKKASRKSGVNKTVEIHKALAATPDKGPKEISDELTAKGIDVKPGYVSTIKTNMKKAEAAAGGEPQAQTASPKLKSVKTKRGVKKRVGAKKKAGRKKKAAAPQAAPVAAPAGPQQRRLARAGRRRPTGLPGRRRDQPPGPGRLA